MHAWRNHSHITASDASYSRLRSASCCCCTAYRQHSNCNSDATIVLQVTQLVLQWAQSVVHLSGSSGVSRITGSNYYVTIVTRVCCPLQVKLPLPSERLQQLCYSGLNSTESERRAVVDSLLNSLQHLEASVGVDSALRRVVEGGGGDWMGQYMIKREFSEGSYHVFGIVIPDLRSSWAADHQSSHVSTTQLAERDSGVTHPAELPATTLSHDAKVYHNPRGTHKHLNAVVRVVHKGQGLVRPLIPGFLAKLRPVAKLLGTNTHSTVKSSISSQSCPDPASFAEAQTNSGILTPIDHSTVCSSTPEQAATKTATAGTTASEADDEAVSEADSGADNEADSAADSEADNSLVTSVESELPDLSSGNGVPTQILLPEQGHLRHPQE